MQAATEVAKGNWHWFRTGHEIFPEMLGAIDAAERTVNLETYIFSADSLGIRFRDALMRACQRGVAVRVLYDALGSMKLPTGFWHPLEQAGGSVRQFNPLALKRLGIRNHRKLLVCDEHVGFFGGFNISEEYEGDGVTCGWCDLGLKVVGPLAKYLSMTFEEMFAKADFRHKRFLRLRQALARRHVLAPNEQVLLSGPGRGGNPIKRALRHDLYRASQVDIMVAYFLPTWRIRRDLTRVVARGGRVRLILAGKSDVTLSLLAGRSLYRRMLKAGIEIYEYQPQILHAKLVIIDGVVYVGSANLDQRSLNINYELMVRFASEPMAKQAREIFDSNLGHTLRITREDWRKSRTWWSRIKQHWAYTVLVRLDPWIAQTQWRDLPD